MEMELDELAERAGVLPRTVRYYVSEGLLPPPMYGKPAKYTEEHLERLILIKRLQKELYMPLDKIRERFARQSTEQIKEYLEQTLLLEAELREQNDAGEVEPGTVARGVTEQSSAMDYIRNVLGRARPAPAAASVPAPPAPAPYAPDLAAMDIEQPKRAVRAFSVSAQSPAQADAPPIPAPDTWLRVTLAPGIELNFIASDDPEFNTRVARLMQ